MDVGLVGRDFLQQCYVSEDREGLQKREKEALNKEYNITRLVFVLRVQMQARLLDNDQTMVNTEDEGK